VTSRQGRADGAVVAAAVAGVVAAAISVAAAGDDSGIRQEKSPRD